MTDKKKPKLILIGMEQNEPYMTIFNLYERREMSIKCHCVKVNERRNTADLMHRVSWADIVLIIIGSVEEYRYFKPMARELKDRCILVFDEFEGRAKCLRRYNKSLLVEGKGKIGDVVSELIAIMILDDSTMLDYMDVFHCAGWRTVVRNDIYRDADEALEKREVRNIDGRKEISLLWFHGELDLCSVVEVTKMVWHEDDMKMFGASYENGQGFGILSFIRDSKEPTEQQTKIVNPFKRHPVRWLAAGCCALTIVCMALSVSLIMQRNTQDATANFRTVVKNEECGIEIRTITSVVTDEQGDEVARYEKDVVTVYGAEYERVAEAIEGQFSLEDMQETLEMLQQFGNGANTTSRIECRRLDGKIISFKENGHYYTGSSGLISAGYTFSVETGKLLELEELLKDKDGFYAGIDALIEKALSEHPDIKEFQVDYEKKYQEAYAAKGRLPGWLLSKDGMTFLFEQGDFIAMAYGCIEVTIPYAEVEKYIREEYR